MAAGSQSNSFFGYPRVCETCGERIHLTGDIPLWFECVDGVKRSYHLTHHPLIAGERKH